MSARNIILVACELEIFICFDDNQRIVIQHKRIRGASWDYFNLCNYNQKQTKRKTLLTLIKIIELRFSYIQNIKNKNKNQDFLQKFFFKFVKLFGL